MKPNIIFAGVLALLNGACAAAPQPVSTPIVEAPVSAPMATKADIPKAHSAVMRMLKDPESVRFSGEFLKPGAVCGNVNSKNSYGGYAGVTPYVYIVSSDQSYEIEGDDITSMENLPALGKLERFCTN
jgi:hypothetical protein